MNANNQRSQISIPQVIPNGKQGSPGTDVICMPVVGTSMAPLLRDRDILIIRSGHPESLTCGDIIVRGEKEMIAHRILVIRHDRVYTRGDARYWIDPMSFRDDIWGTVILINRNGLIADMESRRWKFINRMIGLCGRIQVYLTWRSQITNNRMDRKIGWHRFYFWFSKKVNWVILFLFAGRWLFHKPLRMDEKC